MDKETKKIPINEETGELYKEFAEHMIRLSNYKYALENLKDSHEKNRKLDLNKENYYN